MWIKQAKEESLHISAPIPAPVTPAAPSIATLRHIHFDDAAIPRKRKLEEDMNLLKTSSVLFKEFPASFESRVAHIYEEVGKAVLEKPYIEWPGIYPK